MDDELELIKATDQIDEIALKCIDFFREHETDYFNVYVNFNDGSRLMISVKATLLENEVKTE